MESFAATRVVQSNLTVFSDTISTTNSNLSGRITTISLNDLPTQVVDYRTLSSYAPLSQQKVVNVALSTGTTALGEPTYLPFTYQSGPNPA